MDFELTKEQVMFRDMAKEFGLKEILPTMKERDRERKYPLDILKKAASLGLMGLKIPAEYGGLGQDWMTLGLVMEQLCYFDFNVGMGVFANQSLGALPIVEWGTEAQKKEYVPATAGGGKLASNAVVEPNAGSDATAIETRATIEGDQWVLNGNKTWISNATLADFTIVLAQTDKGKEGKGPTTFLVDKGTPGFSNKRIEHNLGIRTSDLGQLFFRDCRIPDAKRLGPIGKGLRVCLGGIENPRFGIAMGSVGVLQACIDASVKYCKERSQFGKPIGSFQLVQEKIAEMTIDCEAARCLAYRLGCLKDKGVPNSRETAITKYFCAEAAVRAARQAVELHGAYGFTDDFPVERFYREMISNLIVGGTSNILKLVIGNFATGIRAFS
jgi:alkylation response protein AidB-like acyl-CoA dehydrogenase